MEEKTYECFDCGAIYSETAEDSALYLYTCPECGGYHTMEILSYEIKA